MAVGFLPSPSGVPSSSLRPRLSSGALIQAITVARPLVRQPFSNSSSKTIFFPQNRLHSGGPSLLPKALLPPNNDKNRKCRHHKYYSSEFWASGFSSLILHRHRLQQQQQQQSQGPQREFVVSPIRAARMESGEVTVGFKAPEFELPEPLTGKTVKLDDFEDQQGLLVMFICNHCPFVKHLKQGLAKFTDEYRLKGLGVVAISSNSVKTHPQDGPEYMADDAKKFKYSFPYLFDETQEVAKAFGAVCTPDFFLFKKDGRRPFELAYHGRFDETRPSTNAPVTGRDLRAAVDAVLSASSVKGDQKPSIGCSIKWHPTK